MAKRKSINRGLRRSLRHRSSDSMNSALLDPDTDIVGEGRTFWWNNLEESTPPRYSRLYSRNETASQLNENSQIDSIQSPPEWWKNLENSNSKHAASTKHNFSAGIVKCNILQISTSESEKESQRGLKKVQLKATKRKSINNAFLKALEQVRTSVGTRKSTSLRLEMESSDDEDAEPARQTIQQDSTLMEAGTNSKTINQQSIQNSNRTSIREDREITRKQRSNLFKSLRKIDDFFKVKQTPTTLEQSNGRVQKSQVFEKMEKIKTELEKIKTREMAAMHIVTDKKKFPLKKKDMKSVQNLKATKVKPLVNHTKVVNKAFLVNGKVYRAPRLLRPKYWATDRLYKFLWNHMEPNYKLATRVKSEKFVQGLAKTVAIIERRKNYKTYKVEVNALMKEMARLNIINTRNDFYHFCQEFMLYEFRVKVVPMLMPGNKNNIPYNSELLHIPLLDVTHEE